MSIVNISRKCSNGLSDAVIYLKSVIQCVAECSPSVLQHPQPSSQMPIETGGGWEIIDPSLSMALSQEMYFKCIIIPAGEGLMHSKT